MQTELPPIVDDSWFCGPDCDAVLAAAQRKGDRRPSARALSRVRPFGRQSHRMRRAVVEIVCLAIGGGLALLALAAANLAYSAG